ncbi:MAG: sigma-E processing peptidase SpoIIGA [Christensenellales bacterium]
MQVYVEIVLLTNLLLNGFILALSIMLVKCRVSVLRVTIGALIGAVYAVVYPYISWAGSWPFKIVLALIMVAVSGGYNSFAHYLTAIAVFFSLTFLLGGVAIGSGYIFGKSIFDSEGYVALSVSAALVFVLCATRIVWKCFVMARRKKNYTYRVVLCQGNNQLATTAYWDSGNRLYYHGYRPVMMIDEKVYQQLYRTNDLHKMTMKVNTVNGRRDMQLQELDKLVVLDTGKTYRKVVVGVSQTSLGEYGMLLHSEF